MKARIRILVLFGNIPLHGSERANIQVMTCLREAGADILFLTNDEYGHESVQPMLDALRHAWIPGRYPKLLGRSRSPREWMDRIHRIRRYNASVIQAIRLYRPTHIHVANENHLFAALPALLLNRVSIVYRLGDEPRSHLPVFRWLWRSVYSQRISAMVCNSEFVASRLKAIAPRFDPRIIRNLPPERPLSTNGSALVSADGLPTIVYVGQLSQAKGVHVLLESALEILDSGMEARFVFAGDYQWQNAFARSLVDRVAERGLANRIIFPGFVEDVPSLLRTASVHVCPSVIEEALPNTIIEAKNASVPSVVFPSGGIPELISHGFDGYVCAAKTKEELVKGLRFYLDGGRDLSIRHGEAAKLSLDRLGITREQFTQAWIEVYESCN